MKPFLSLVGLLATTIPVVAQQASPALSEAEIQARRDSIVNLESHIGLRQERLDEIVADIRRLDARVEEGVDEIVTMLGQVKDSEESKVRIATLKADVIGGLRRTIDYYKKNRDAIREQLRTGKSDLSKETLEKDLEIFDTRIQKRIDQIGGLAKSFTDPQELEKYVVTSFSYRFGEWDANTEISEAWKQNRRESRHTESARAGVAKGLSENIAFLEERNDYLRGKLKESGLSDLERDFYEADIARNEALMGQRAKQLEEYSSGSAPETSSLERGDAHQMDQLVQSARTDLREDFFSIFRKYAELNRARAELKSLEENLAARKAWMKEYDAKQ